MRVRAAQAILPTAPAAMAKPTRCISKTRTNEDGVFYPGGLSLAPVHPGRMIAAELEVRGLSAHAAALKMRIPANRLSLIIAGRRGISADTALRLARLFGTSAQFWMSLQGHYELAIAERETGEKIAREVEAG